MILQRSTSEEQRQKTPRHLIIMMTKKTTRKIYK